MHHGAQCTLSAVGGVSGASTKALVKWHGDRTTAMCHFRGLDLRAWNGVKLIQGFACNLPVNPVSPFQDGITTFDSWLRVNARGNGVVHCSGSQP